MNITSLDIRDHEFDRSFRGYNVEEVNNFLNDLGREWDKMLNELKLVKMQLDVSEKNLAKFHDMESTLLSTLKTSEKTSKQKIDEAEQEAAIIISDSIKKADHTTFEAEEKARTILEDAQNKAEQVLKDAQLASKNLISESEQKAKFLEENAHLEIRSLNKKYDEIEAKRLEVINQLKAYNISLTNLINNPGVVETKVPDFKVEKLTGESPEETAIEETIQDEISDPSAVEEDIIISEEVSIPSSINKMTEESDLELIEGIGPKIKEILYDAGIKSFRTLAITPEYKLKDILATAGPQYNMHDPGTWNEQALLAENGKWDELKELQDRLVGGRPEEEESAAVETDGKDTDDMLDKVNKVKAAIRKAMSEKPKDAPAESDESKSGSFFDGL